MRYGTKIRRSAITAAILFSTLVASTVHASAGGVKVSHLFNLSNFSGTVPYSEVRVSVDRRHNETYVVDADQVRVFNEAGMEVYRFGEDPELGSVRDLVVDEKGDIHTLSYDFSQPGTPKFFLCRCNYRGEILEKRTIQGLPTEYSGILPNMLFQRAGRFLLVDRTRMLAVEAGEDGAFRTGFDFNRLLEIPEKDRPGTEIFGFSVDEDWNMLFTVPVLFRAFRLSPDGELSSFGKVGSAPGMFGIVTGIVADGQGHFLVADALRSVVMVFDADFKFLTEFGYRGDRPENLVGPKGLAIGTEGKLYVTQLRKRGVAVFKVTPN